MNSSSVRDLANLISKSNFIVALTGAGISTSAGIPDFRGPKGLYVTKKYDPETVFDITHFRYDPKPFFDFARDFVGLEETIKPTKAHYALSTLETSGKLKGVITQNIDSLHQMAGSKTVYEIHGSFWKSHCMKTGREYAYEELKQKLFKEDVPKSEAGGVIKPDIVFFGENVKSFNESAALVEQCDLLLIIGSSCVVYPAASLPQVAPGKIAIINGTEVDLPLMNIELQINDDIDRVFNELEEILNA